MRLLVQPDDGVRPLLNAITSARRSIEIVIFRFEQREVERALANAVSRGVAVHALIAHTNRAGEDSLRRLETRLLAAGVTVARTDDDLARYHGKFMIVDNHELYVLAFNPTYNDIDRSRSFGVATKKPELIKEAARLIDADSKRYPYEPEGDKLVVSPVNARKLLSEFITGAKKELLIYDPKVSDLAIVHLLEERAAAGVHIKVIGRLTRGIPGVTVRKMPQMRLHTRTLVRDGKAAFIGSQSLRTVELDARREVGIIFSEPKVVTRIQKTFMEDWTAEQTAKNTEDQQPANKLAKKVAKLVSKDLPEVASVLNGAVKEIASADGSVPALEPEEIEAALRGAVKTAVKEVVNDMLSGAVEADAGRAR